jgi:hypothetical protein
MTSAEKTALMAVVVLAVLLLALWLRRAEGGKPQSGPLPEP